MKKIIYLLLCLSFTCAIGLNAQRESLHFKDGKFRLMQLSDIHWTEGTDFCPRTIKTIKEVVALEKPQLVVITGDVVTGQPAREGWQSIIKLFEELHLPFVVTMGNHDPEFLPRDEMYAMLVKSPYYVGERGARELTGAGNCVVPIYGSKDRNKAEALIYCFDSNDYLPTDKYGHYDWIHNDQIQWYRKLSDDWTKANQGKPLPALACFHIPIPEYKAVYKDGKYLGNFKDEGIGSPMINSGLFNAFVEKGDVMGVLAGHDHDSDFIGLHYGIALAYGRVSGWEAYGSMERGCRMIELYEGKKRFDSWVRTPKMKEDVFYYPSGLTSRDEKTLPMLPAQKVKAPKHGVSYAYLEVEVESVKEIMTCLALAKERGVMPNFSIKGAKREDHFAYVFSSYIKVPKSGVYEFALYSDDGSALLIDERPIVDNDGGHSARWRKGKVVLEAGFHRLDVLYFEDYMGQELKVNLSSPDFEQAPIPNSWLYQNNLPSALSLQKQ